MAKKSLSAVLVSCLAFFIGLALLRPVFSSEPQTIDDLGLNNVTNDSLFSSVFTLKHENNVSYGSGQRSSIKTNIEVEGVKLDELNLTGLKPMREVDKLDNLTSEYQSQGLKIKRLSSSWKNEAGTFTVGSDWANFQDFLGIDKEVDDLASSRSVANQIKWLSPNGFSISLEDSPQDAIFSSGAELDAGDLDESLPSLILSWQGGPGGVAGEYRVSAMGKKLDLSSGGQIFDGKDIVGWGLNLEGGWQIGDLFAVLSVTYGKGINSYVLQRYGNDLLVTPNQLDKNGNAISIRPSLYYSLNNNSNFHVALGHYSTEESSSNAIDTLDTIHMGYSWNPWPSTRLGLELIGKNSDGPNGQVGDTQLTFGAKTRF